MRLQAQLKEWTEYQNELPDRPAVECLDSALPSSIKTWSSTEMHLCDIKKKLPMITKKERKIFQFLHLPNLKISFKHLKYKVPICIFYKSISLKNTIKLDFKKKTIVQIGVWVTNLRTSDIIRWCAATDPPPAPSSVLDERHGRTWVLPRSSSCTWRTGSLRRAAVWAARCLSVWAAAWRWSSWTDSDLLPLKSYQDTLSLGWKEDEAPRRAEGRLWCKEECLFL